MHYYSNLPRSDELYHHGIKGQKWGVRRYQNPDGSLTTAGRIRYYGSEATKKLGTYLSEAKKKTASVAGKIGSSVKNKLVTAIKKRHPSLMSDQELIEFKKRLDLERSYKQAVSDMKSQRFLNRTAKGVSDIMGKAAGKMADKFGEKVGASLADRMFRTESARLKEKNAILDEKLNRINKIRALSDASDRERNLRDTDIATRSRQASNDIGGGDNVYSRVADRYDRRINERLERMQNRTATNDRNIVATRSSLPQDNSDNQTNQNSGKKKKKKQRPAHLGTQTFRPNN